VTRHVVIRLPEDVYNELEKRAKDEGFLLVSDYVREIISRELGKTPFNPRMLEARLERIEMGELPPRLYETVAKVVEEVLASKMPELIESLNKDELTISYNEGKIVEKITKKLERKIQSELIPWTQKIDELARRIADIKEELDKLKEEAKERQQVSEKKEIPKVHHAYQQPPYYEQRLERRERRSTAIERLKRQGAVFEDELKSIRSKDYFFAKLKSSGAIVLQTQKHGRVAVHPDAWKEFMEMLQSTESSNEEEILEKLENEGLRKLFEALRSEGVLIYDSGSHSWKLIEDIEWR